MKSGAEIYKNLVDIINEIKAENPQIDLLSLIGTVKLMVYERYPEFSGQDKEDAMEFAEQSKNEVIMVLLFSIAYNLKKNKFILENYNTLMLKLAFEQRDLITIDKLINSVKNNPEFRLPLNYGEIRLIFKKLVKYNDIILLDKILELTSNNKELQDRLMSSFNHVIFLNTVGYGYFEIVKRFVRHKQSDIKLLNDMIFHRFDICYKTAAEKNYYQILEYLIGLIVDENRKEQIINNTLRIAAKKNSIESLKMLLELSQPQKHRALLTIIVENLNPKSSNENFKNFYELFLDSLPTHSLLEKLNSDKFFLKILMLNKTDVVNLIYKITDVSEDEHKYKKLTQEEWEALICKDDFKDFKEIPQKGCAEMSEYILETLNNRPIRNDLINSCLNIALSSGFKSIREQFIELVGNNPKSVKSFLEYKDSNDQKLSSRAKGTFNSASDSIKTIVDVTHTKNYTHGYNTTTITSLADVRTKLGYKVVLYNSIDKFVRFLHPLSQTCKDPLKGLLSNELLLKLPFDMMMGILSHLYPFDKLMGKETFVTKILLCEKTSKTLEAQPMQ